MNTVRFLNTEEMKKEQNYFSTDGKIVIGMVVDDKLVAHVDFFDSGDHETNIDMIYVNEGCRGNGYSNLLLNKVLEFFPETLAFTGESTSKALEFWKAKGVVFHPDAFVEYPTLEGSEVEDGIVFDQLYPFSLKLNKDSSYIPYWEAS